MCMLAMHQFVIDDRWFQAMRLPIAQNQVSRYIDKWMSRCRCVLTSISRFHAFTTIERAYTSRKRQRIPFTEWSICPNWLLHCAMQWNINYQCKLSDSIYIHVNIWTMFITHNKAICIFAPCTTFYWNCLSCECAGCCCELCDISSAGAVAPLNIWNSIALHCVFRFHHIKSTSLNCKSEQQSDFGNINIKQIM